MSRHLICTLVGALALICVLLLTPKSNYVPHGIILPAKTVRAAIDPDQVTLYEHDPVNEQQVLGHISIEMALNQLNEATRDAMLAKIRALAASVGANGVVVNVFVPGDGVRKLLIFMGTAIYASPTAGSKK